MPFDPNQIAELNKPLDRRYVKPPAPGKYGDYVEGWHVIAEANRIFGFDGWTRETVSMVETNRELITLQGQRSEYQQWRVGYVAKVRVTAGGIARDGTGFGSGMSKPEALGEAIESAVKEAETDAMKRALMTFGNPFGLALYDKGQANVVDGAAAERAEKSKAESRDTYARLSRANRDLASEDEFNAFWARPDVQDAAKSLPADWKRSLKTEKEDKAAELAERVALSTPDERLDRMEAAQ